MLTSLIASLIVLGVTVVVLNEWLERRDRRRWSVLAQYVLFQLVQAARATWTSLAELIVRARDRARRRRRSCAPRAASLDAADALGRDARLLADPRRRALLQEALVAARRALAQGRRQLGLGDGRVRPLHRRLRPPRRAPGPPRLDQRDPHDQRARRAAHAARLQARPLVGGDRARRRRSAPTTGCTTRSSRRSSWRRASTTSRARSGFRLVPMEWWNARTQARDRRPQRLSSQIRRRPSSVSRSSTTSIVAVNAGTRWWARPPVAIAGASTPSSSRRRPTMPSTWPAKP